jgi:exopolysaccharide biosynthesis protein
MLRFPGATLAQLQEMLLDPSLNVDDALNLDGGGSSQLFVEKNLRIADETFISGGDVVPVGLIVKRRKKERALKGGD